MIYLHTELHMPSFIGFLVITFKPKPSIFLHPQYCSFTFYKKKGIKV